MIRYKYYLMERPPGPGCQPTDGLCETQDYGYQRECMGEMVRAWGFALYRRRLSPEEVKKYELAYGGEVARPEKQGNKGKEWTDTQDFWK